MPETRTIGKLARDAGVHVETVRYYERRGLLRQPRARGRGVRQYDDTTLATLCFIRRAQSVGFSLEEIRELLTLRQSRRPDSCARVRSKAQAKLADVESKLAELQALRGMLVDFIASCDVRQDDEECPILEGIAQMERPARG